MILLNSGYTYTRITMTIIGPTSYTQSNISLSSTKLSVSEQVSSSNNLIVNTVQYTNNLTEKSDFKLSLNLTWIIRNTTQIAYSLVPYDGHDVPEWVKLDTDDFCIYGTTEDIDVDTIYKFAVNATVNYVTYQKVIML